MPLRPPSRVAFRTASPKPATDNETGHDRLKTDDDLMSEQFRAFIDEVLRAPQRVFETRETDPALAAQSLNRHLLRLIELQTARIERDVSRLELDNVADARYLKVALADELLLAMPWIGRERWTEHLLESSLYRSNVAGDQVFQRIDSMLADREPSRRKMARLYLLALAMGFQGRYRHHGAHAGRPFPASEAAHLPDPYAAPRERTETTASVPPDTDARLRAYRQELFQFVFQRRPDLGGRDRVLDESAYAHTLSHLAPRRLPSVSRWLLRVMITIAALFAISEIVWLSSTWSVRDALHSQFAPGRAPISPSVPGLDGAGAGS